MACFYDLPHNRRCPKIVIKPHDWVIVGEVVYNTGSLGLVQQKPQLSWIWKNTLEYLNTLHN